MQIKGSYVRSYYRVDITLTWHSFPRLHEVSAGLGPSAETSLLPYYFDKNRPSHKIYIVQYGCSCSHTVHHFRINCHSLFINPH